MKRPVFLAVGAAALLFGALLAWNTVRQEREFRRLVAAGDAALAQDQTFGAIEAFSGALALKHDSMVAHLKRGDSYRRRGELAAALRDLREAAELDPTAPRPAELLGDVNAAMGRHQRATEHYHRFVSLDDRAPRVLYKLGLSYYRIGKIAEAMDSLRRAVAIDERLPEAHYLLGVCLREAKRPADAVGSLQRAVILNPAFAPAREELADLYGSMARTRDQIEQLEALAALEPSRAERLVSVGAAYARAGRTEAAVTTLGRAAERYPDKPAVYAALGRVWLDVAEDHHDKVAVSKALEALQSAATLDAASSETLTLYGRALALSGNPSAAELVLQQAVTHTPVTPIAFMYLAQTAERLRHFGLAREAIEHYEALTDERVP
jgi:tetratricopeptide (TPR) repeat protein